MTAGMPYAEAFDKNQCHTVTDPETGNIIAVQGADREPTGFA